MDRFPKPEEILVLQTSFIGDTILTLPLISEIKLRFPLSRLTVLCSPLGKEFLQEHPDIDEVIVDDKRGMDRGLRGLWRKAGELKQMDFTLALTPHKSLRSALLLYLAGIPCRVGFRQSKGWFLFHQRVDRSAEKHDVERNLSLLRPFGFYPLERPRPLHLPVNPASREAVRGLFSSLGVDTSQLIIGINPGSVWPTKRWSAEGFAELVRLLKRQYGCEVLLFGGPEDVPVASAIEARSGGGAVNLAGKIALRELPAALSLCRVLITNDSGPMHIAVACNVPTVAIFCATTPALGFYPYSAESIVIEKELACRPCGTHGGRRCPLGTEDCIHLIPVEQIFSAVKKLLERKRQAPPAYGSEAEPRPEYVVI
jgi:heptosyltransferase II